MNLQFQAELVHTFPEYEVVFCDLYPHFHCLIKSVKKLMGLGFRFGEKLRKTLNSREKDWRFDWGLASQFPVFRELRTVISA